ncbi:MAG: hypothetical protein M3R72_10245 [Bacteroidota bacterium]|nr:hypothetical protein [Bacteroidota bacterium]
MKKITLSLLFASIVCVAMAQDYTKVSTFYTLKKYDDAKKELDKIAASDKGKDKADTYLWEAALNSEFYKDSTDASKYPNAAEDAYNALMTYEQKDTSLKALRGNGSLNSIAALYTTSFNEGKKYFTQSNWPLAFTNFKRAEGMSEFINKHGFNSNKSAVDTFTILYTGYAAQNAGKLDDAVTYYQKLADIKAGGKDLQPMYQYMLDDFQRLKQPDKFTKYLAVAKQLYPDQSSMWTQMEMSNMTSGSSLQQIIDKYKAEANGSLTEDQLVAYAEAFNDPEKSKTLDSSQQIELKKTSAEIYEKLFTMNPNKGLYAFNAGVLQYNIFNVFDDRYYALRGEGASLKVKRTDIQKAQVPYADSAIYWLEKGYNVMKAKTDRDKNESSSLNRSVDFLANLYQWKRERTKGVAPKDYDKYDAKFNQFSNEHDKYKSM